MRGPPPEAQALSYVTACGADKGTPGIAVAVSSKGRLVVSAGVGFADLANLVPANGSTVFNIGSISKVHTAVAVMQLVEQGKVSLDDPIQKYVPAFPEKPEGAIRIRHLLTHTSGVRHYGSNDFPDSEDNESIRPLSWEAGLAIFKDDALLFPSGSVLSGTPRIAVNLLHGVVEKASGLPFEDYMIQKVWGTRGHVEHVASTGPRESFLIAPRATEWSTVAWPTTSTTTSRYKFASGGMISTAEDLCRLGSCPEPRGTPQGGNNSAHVRAHLDPVMRFEGTQPPQKMDFAQGLLWRVFKDAAGRTFVNHCGDGEGLQRAAS